MNFKETARFNAGRALEKAEKAPTYEEQVDILADELIRAFREGMKKGELRAGRN